MGGGQSTRKCPRCGVELSESNMVKHMDNCVCAAADGKADGSWNCKINGPVNAVAALPDAINAAKHKAIEKRT